MINSELNALRAKLEDLEEHLDDMEFDELTERVYELENEIQIRLREAFDDEYEHYQKLNKKVQRIKKENNFYDPEAELDRMFPNRYDDDFDEDSMSYDSIFGGD